ncbi:hypothetical protein [Parachlamydia sp. AcF125]|uniref:hypothetical protein n=1 Tax=Parachlamydia sp. AcF125 TaxID=2795736 RepID=UPI001BCA572B|nr:hypothetical protein [Parachlamydia sp. AcF125]MBS4167495.1 hypothetical protein [Parachlamydia sp. AcF125]
MNFLLKLQIGLLGLSLSLLCVCAHAEIAPASSEKISEVELVTFTPPSGWRVADSKELPKHVNVMVVGKGEREFPPSINLATEHYTKSLNDYLKRIKEINQSLGIEWKNLGPIQTEAGEANLSQIEEKSQWGDLRMMHVVLIKDNTAYILTAASLKEEFPKFYKDFFASLKSLRFIKGQRNTMENKI